MRLHVVEMRRQLFSHDLMNAFPGQDRPYGARLRRTEALPQVLGKCYPMQRRSTKSRPNLRRPGRVRGYFARVNWATLIKRRRNRSAQPVR
uniref:Uncharacterized protein n=1 Tax=Mycobacterium kansasii TaxID=1768 RepID=A0A653EYT0_MYCKA|nr:hypothetical protein BIN_B_03521 [Mycobacterium kansasii]